MKSRFYLSVLFFLAGCGSDSNNIVPKEYTGIWSDIQTINQLENEKYILIEGNGDITYYNYLGDSYDQGQNCFIVTKQANLTPIEENVFEYTENGDTSWVKLTVIEETLNFVQGDVGSSFENAGSFGIVFEYEFNSNSTNRLDLTPLCQA